MLLVVPGTSSTSPISAPGIYIENPKKLDERSKKVIFVGYDKCNSAYLVYFPEKEVVRLVRTVKFNKEYSNLSKKDASDKDTTNKNDEINIQLLKE